MFLSLCPIMLLCLRLNAINFAHKYLTPFNMYVLLFLSPLQNWRWFHIIKRRGLKSRFLSQIVNAANPTYLYDTCLRGDDVEFRVSRPYAAISYAPTSGYSLVVAEVCIYGGENLHVLHITYMCTYSLLTVYFQFVLSSTFLINYAVYLFKKIKIKSMHMKIISSYFCTHQLHIYVYIKLDAREFRIYERLTPEALTAKIASEVYVCYVRLTFGYSNWSSLLF
jgi:hypothetical protein